MLVCHKTAFLNYLAVVREAFLGRGGIGERAAHPPPPCLFAQLFPLTTDRLSGARLVEWNPQLVHMIPPVVGIALRKTSGPPACL